MTGRENKMASALKHVEPFVTTDGSRIGFNLEDAQQNKLSIALKPDELGRLIGFMLAASIEASKSLVLPESSKETIISSPVQLNGISIVPGRTATEALIAVKCGAVPVTFSLDTGILLKVLEQLKATTLRLAPEDTKKH